MGAQEGQAQGEARWAQRPRPQKRNGSRKPAPGLGTVEAVLTCSVFALPRPEQLAPACRCLQGETPLHAAARLPPPLPTQSQPGSPEVGPCQPGADLSPGPEAPHPHCAGYAPDSSQVASPSRRRRCPSTLPPEPTMEAVPFGCHSALTQKQLFGLSAAQALQSSNRLRGWGPCNLGVFSPQGGWEAPGPSAEWYTETHLYIFFSSDKIELPSCWSASIHDTRSSCRPGKLPESM